MQEENRTSTVMSSFAAKENVVQSVLEAFRCELRALRSGWFMRTLMGDAPTEGYVRQLSELDARSHMSGQILGVWRITQNDMAVLPVSFIIPPASHRSGMYFDRGTFDFVVAPDRKTVVVGWQVGPRFGRGFRYEIVTDDRGHTSLGLAETLWKS